MGKKNRVDYRDESVWKARLDELKAEALKNWKSSADAAALVGSIAPVLVHDWKVELSVSGGGPGRDVWIFSARWPKEGEEPPVEELVWTRQAVAYLGAPEDVKENPPSPTTKARYWIWFSNHVEKTAYQIHHDCKPIPGRERIAATRDALLNKNPNDPYGGLHWLCAHGEFLECSCGVCGEKFKEGEAVTVLGVDW